jgi:hypothetical protein
MSKKCKDKCKCDNGKNGKKGKKKCCESNA